MTMTPTDQAVRDRLLRVDLQIACSELRDAVAGYLASEPLQPRARLDVVGKDANPTGHTDIRISDQLPCEQPSQVERLEPAPGGPGRILLMLDDLPYEGLLNLLRCYDSCGILLADCPMHQIGDAIEVVGFGGHWVSPSVVRRVRERTDPARAEPRPEPAAGAQVTPAEHLVLGLVVRGMSNREISAELNVALTTIRTHIRAVLRKTGCANRHQLIALVLGRWKFDPWDEAPPSALPLASPSMEGGSSGASPPPLPMPSPARRLT